MTVTLDPAAQSRLDALRAAYFPAGRTQVPHAHVTLFHALPGEQLPHVLEAMTRAAGDTFVIRVAAVVSLGRGVAYRLTSDRLAAVHRELAAQFDVWLTRQDRQGFRPHVTIANKLPPAAARALHGELASAFEPWDAEAHGLALWHYRGGPWEHAATVRFHRSTPPEPSPVTGLRS